MYIPTDIQEQYNLKEYIVDGHVYAEISKGMYGLPQAGKVASDFLIPRLAAAGYHETGVIPGLFKHESNSVTFALVVDDFLIKYSDQKDLDHLKNTLNENYECTLDEKAEKFVGITLDWNYEKGYVDASMPGYIEKAMQRFTHPVPKKPQAAPSKWTAPDYGASVQYAEPDDETNHLDKSGITRLQEIIGVLLYYARAVDNTMLVALGTLASAQTQGTEATMDAATLLLNYAASNPDATVRWHASDMILHIHSDASYLSEPKARSRVGGFFYLGNKDESNDNPHPNGPIHVESRIMKNVMSSAAEAETGALFHNGQEGAYFRQILMELGHPQPGPTPIITDNSTAEGFANNRTKVKRSKAMDMRFYWIRDRVGQGMFQVRWSPGKGNLADYFTKHHPPAHHILMRPTYLHTGNTANTASECKGVLIWDSGLTQSLASNSSTGIQYCGYSHLAPGLANRLMVLANPLGSPCSLPVYGCLGTGSKLPFRAPNGKAYSSR